jgi:hypothetical protein
MELSEIRAEIRNITGVDDTSVVADSVLTDLINKGQNILADEANLFYGYGKRNSVAGTSKYQILNGNGLSVTAWTIVENTAGSSSQSLANMIRITLMVKKPLVLVWIKFIIFLVTMLL